MQAYMKIEPMGRMLDTYRKYDAAYNLIDAFQMKIWMSELTRLIEKYTEIRNDVKSSFDAAIKEYLEAGIHESDGVYIIITKEGRANLNETKARENFPDVCKEAETVVDGFDLEKFKSENPEIYAKYRFDIKNITLTNIRNLKKLTPEQEETIINRAPNQYSVAVAGE